MSSSTKIFGVLAACLGVGISIFVASVACSDGGGSSGEGDSPSNAGSTAGGGSSGGGAGAGVLSPFTGKWKIDSSDVTSQCDNQEAVPNPAQGEVNVAATADGQLELTYGTGCPIVHSVSGTTATAAAGQKCEQKGENTSSSEVVRSVFTTADGKAAQIEMESRVKITFTAQNSTIDCTLRGTNQLSRVE